MVHRDKAASSVESGLRMSQREDRRRDRQASKYHGLYNQGATCYLNSVLQVLFMTKDFREAVESSTDKNPDTMDRALNHLFSDLENKSTNTDNITKALDINTVYEQRDAAEYIEKILRLTSNDASQIFHGRMSHRTECQCGTETVSDEAFWHLPLALVDSCSDGYSVVNGIQNFFKVSVFSGEDQMYCDKCDDKADAKAQYVMKHYPNVLILLLKRFKFDYHHMSYVKISSIVDVPSTIDIPKGQTYKLYAVVDHFGDLRGGHYTATIKDEDEDRWYNFNDSSVTPCDDQLFQVDNMKRSRTAQLLFYRMMKEAVNQDMSTNHNECEDAEKTIQRYEGEDDANTKDDTVVAVSAGNNEVRGNEGEVRDVCKGVGLSEEADNKGNVSQTGTHRNQAGKDEIRDDYHQDASVNMQEIEGGTQSGDDEEDIRGQEEADDQTQNVRLLSVENKQTESIKNETAESDTGRERMLDANLKPDVNDQPKICDLPNPQEETNDAQSRVTDNDVMTGGKDLENPPMDYFNKDAEHLREGGLYKQNRNEDQDSSLKTGQQFDPEHMDKQEDEEKERESRAKEFPSESVSNSGLDKNPEQQGKDERREVQESNEQKRPDPDKNMMEMKIQTMEDFIMPDHTRAEISLLNSLVKDNEETVRCQIKKDKKVSCKDGTVGSSTQSKPSDNQESKRDISHSLERHVEDKRGEKNHSQRDGGHEQRRGSGRKGSEGGKSKDSERLNEGNGQRNVKEIQAKDKEEKGDPEQFHNREENQDRDSEQRRFHNKGPDYQPDEGSVQLSVKDTGPVNTDKPGSSKESLNRGKKRTGAAEEASNSSHDDQNTDSLTESVNSLILTNSPVRESKKYKVGGAEKRKQPGKKTEQKKTKEKP